MTSETRAVLERAEDMKVDLRTAAYASALDRLSAAIEAQGTSAYFGHNAD